MVRSAYHYIAEGWNERSDAMISLIRERLIGWRREPSVVRMDNPTRLDRARALGYKSKQGFLVVRVKVRKGGLNRPRPNSGRRPKRMGVHGYAPAKPTQLIAEERANDKYPNLEVLGSYYVGEDGIYKYYEVVMVDPHHPAIKSDPDINWITESQHSGRVYRGKTSSGRRMRGLLGNRGLRGTHKWKWGKKMKERLLGRRHEASRGARLVAPKDIYEDLNIRK